MAIRCEDLMTLKSFQQLRLLGGHGGLDRLVRCPYVTLTNTIAQWVHGGEFMFVSGKDLHCDEESLSNLIEESYRKKLAGIAVLTDEQGDFAISDKLIALADQYCLPLFEMPYQLPLVEITEEISSFIIQARMKTQLVQELMLAIFADQGEQSRDIIARAAFYHYDISGSNQIAIVALQNIQKLFQENDVFVVERAMDYMAALQSYIDSICRRSNWRFLSMVSYGAVILLLPQENRVQSEHILGQIYDFVASTFDNPELQIGVGNAYTELADMKRSRLEAERALLVGAASAHTVTFYQDIGIYKILFEMNNLSILEEFFAEVLGILQTYDDNNQAHLLSTLEVYLEENCNLVRTADKLYIHRNSLLYRIRKIKELTGYDLTKADSRSRCREALLIGRFLRMKS